jgi:hypothetical protein
VVIDIVTISIRFLSVITHAPAVTVCGHAKEATWHSGGDSAARPRMPVLPIS